MYQIPEFKKFTKLTHGFSTKDEGNMSFYWGDKEKVFQSRKKIFSKLGIDLNSCITLGIQDKDKLVVINKGLSEEGEIDGYENRMHADGIITKEKNIFLLLLVADCLPIIFFDPQKQVIALAHAGWKSTEHKIAYKISKKLIDEFDCNPSNLCVAIGPSIHKESFKFKDPVQKQLPGWEPFLKDSLDGRMGIDLIGYNKKQLEDAGIDSKNIFISDIDTVQDTNFFSHYRDSQQDPKNEGRFICIVGLKA